MTRPTADELEAMPPAEFAAFLKETGMTRPSREALAAALRCNDPEHPGGAWCAGTTGLDRCHDPHEADPPMSLATALNYALNQWAMYADTDRGLGRDFGYIAESTDGGDAEAEMFAKARAALPPAEVVEDPSGPRASLVQLIHDFDPIHEDGFHHIDCDALAVALLANGWRGDPR